MAEKSPSFNASFAHLNRKTRNLQKRIVKAYLENNPRKVDYLSQQLLKSLRVTQLAVNKVTKNKGGKTAGIDRQIWRSKAEQDEAAYRLQTPHAYEAKALRRVYIQKEDGKKRALGIPTLDDRAMQAKAKMVLEPILEEISDAHSYAYRPKRNPQQAVLRCQEFFSQPGEWWVLKADIQACFDRISHAFILENLPVKSLTDLIYQWLKAGYLEHDIFYATEAGTPQGGIISPLLANMVLDGLEGLIVSTFPDTYVIRYADDILILSLNIQVIYDSMKTVKVFLAERGLELSQNKTSIHSASEGFDYLSAHLQKVNNQVIVQPSEKSFNKLFSKIDTICQAATPARRYKTIAQIHQRIQSWSGYHKVWLRAEHQALIDQKVKAAIEQLP